MTPRECGFEFTSSLRSIHNDMQVIISHKIIISSSPVTLGVLGPDRVTLTLITLANSLNIQNGSIVSITTPAS